MGYSEVEIQLLSLSTFFPHPKAARPCIRCSSRFGRVERRVNTRLLGLLFWHRDGYDLVIYDWRSGVVIMVRLRQITYQRQLNL